MISYNKLCEKHNRILYTTILFTLYSAPPSAYARSAHARLCPAPSRPPQAPHRACALPRAPRLQNPAWTFCLYSHGQSIFYTPADGLSKCRCCRFSLCCFLPHLFQGMSFLLAPVPVRCRTSTLRPESVKTSGGSSRSASEQITSAVPSSALHKRNQAIH